MASAYRVRDRRHPARDIARSICPELEYNCDTTTQSHRDTPSHSLGHRSVHYVTNCALDHIREVKNDIRIIRATSGT